MIHEPQAIPQTTS